MDASSLVADELEIGVARVGMRGSGLPLDRPPYRHKEAPRGDEHADWRVTLSEDGCEFHLQFARWPGDIVNEATTHLAKHGEVTITVEIDAASPDGYDDKTRRTDLENAIQLGFDSQTFENRVE